MVSGRQRYHRAGGLGHAVALGKSAAKNRNRSTQQRFADRRCAVHQQLQATDVDRVDLGGVEQHLDDSRHEEGVGAPVLGDRPHTLTLVPPAPARLNQKSPVSVESGSNPKMSVML